MFQANLSCVVALSFLTTFFRKKGEYSIFSSERASGHFFLLTDTLQGSKDRTEHAQRMQMQRVVSNLPYLGNHNIKS